MKIYKLESLDQYAGLTAVQAPQGSQPLAAPQPEYFADEAALNERLAQLGADPARGLDNGQFRSYKSHLGQYTVTDIEAKESKKAEVVSE